MDFAHWSPALPCVICASKGTRKMPPKGFKCKQCGNCCLNLNTASTSVSEEDIRMWEKEGRSDILEWVDFIPIGENSFVSDIWIDPVTNDDVEICPWLGKLPNQDKYVCSIHDVKPEIGGKYPRSRKHAEETGCRGFED